MRQVGRLRENQRLNGRVLSFHDGFYLIVDDNAVEESQTEVRRGMKIVNLADDHRKEQFISDDWFADVCDVGQVQGVLRGWPILKRNFDALMEQYPHLAPHAV